MLHFLLPGVAQSQRQIQFTHSTQTKPFIFEMIWIWAPQFLHLLILYDLKQTLLWGEQITTVTSNLSSHAGPGLGHTLIQSEWVT